MRSLRFIILLFSIILAGCIIQVVHAGELRLQTSWQSYQDSDYNFQFIYPRGWSIDTLYSDPSSAPGINQKRIALRDETASLVYVSVWGLADGQDLEEWLRSHGRHFYSSNTIIPSITATPGHNNAIFILSPADEQLPNIAALIIQDGNLVYAMEYIARDQGMNQELVATIFNSFNLKGESFSVDLPSLPWIPAQVDALVQDCCGYHDGQPNPYLCSGGNCVWWAAFKRDDITNENLGNAMNWITNAPNYGFPVGKVPVVGAVVVYQPGVQWAGSVGHVAYVESVNPANPNSFTITEMSWGGNCSVNARTSYVQNGVDFIYNKNIVSRPAYLDASDGLYSNKISVSWNASNGATHYQLWRGLTPSSASSVSLGLNLPTPQFDDTAIAPGTLYYYWVIACNGSICTNFSSYNSGFANVVTPPNPPPSPSASDGTSADTITISWLPVTSATTYEIWRGTIPNQTIATLVGSTSENTYLDAGAISGGLYYYWIKSCDLDGCSAFSPFDTGYTSWLAAPANLEASDGIYPGYVQLTFTSVPDATAYELFRNTENNINTASLITNSVGSPILDYSASPGISYYYWVRGINELVIGSFSDPDTGSVEPLTIPGAFEKLMPSQGSQNQPVDLNLTWSSSLGAQSYQVCLDTTADDHCDGTWFSTGLANSYFITGLAPELVYQWQVRALNSNGMTYADGSTAAWNSFSTHLECFFLDVSHSGSGSNPLVNPLKSSGCEEPGTYISGEIITFTNASADPAWRIGSWSGTDNNSLTSSSNTLSMPFNHRKVEVNYLLNCFNLTVTKAGPGTMPVRNPVSSPGCLAGQYIPGEVITLSGADADTGYYISGWIGTANNSNTNPTNTLTMPAANHSAGVVYSPECYSLNFDFEPAGAGTVDLDYPDRCDSGAFPYGTIVTVTALPASGNYRFLGWSGHMTGSNNPGQVTMIGDRVITVHFEESTFIDVPFTHPQYAYIEALWDGGYTAGCNSTPLAFCPNTILNRAMSAVFMLRGDFGSGYMPSLGPELVFQDDWSPGIWAQAWAEAMWNEGLTAGCATNPRLFCPWSQFPRVQASVFGLRLKYGNDYWPPPGTGTLLADVNPAYANWEWGGAWIEQAYRDGLLPACGMQDGIPLFCPDDLVNRGWAAYLIVQAKNLTIP